MLRNQESIASLTKYLFYINAFIWMFFSITSLYILRGNPIYPQNMLGFIVVLMFCNSAALFLSGYWIKSRRTITKIFSITVLLVNILLTFTDEFGFFDLATLLLDIVLLCLVIFLIISNRRSEKSKFQERAG